MGAGPPTGSKNSEVEKQTTGGDALQTIFGLLHPSATKYCWPNKLLISILRLHHSSFAWFPVQNNPSLSHCGAYLKGRGVCLVWNLQSCSFRPPQTSSQELLHPGGLKGLTVPPADDLHDARREEAHSVHASLAVVDVAFPASVHVLLQHLQRAKVSWRLI